MKSYYHDMYAVLVGDLGAYKLFHERQAYSALCQAIQAVTDGHCVNSIETQDKAVNFLRKHGTRATRAYAKSLERG
jgi:hypothetical protein